MGMKKEASQESKCSMVVLSKNKKRKSKSKNTRKNLHGGGCVLKPYLQLLERSYIKYSTFKPSDIIIDMGIPIPINDVDTTSIYGLLKDLNIRKINTTNYSLIPYYFIEDLDIKTQDDVERLSHSALRVLR